MELDMVLLPRSEVYVVIEHARRGKDAIVHGVYSGRRCALAKKIRIESRRKTGYIAILQTKLKGNTKLGIMDMPVNRNNDEE